MDVVPLILAVSPVIIVFICVLFLRLRADIAGLAGLLTALLASLLYFQTDCAVIFKAILAGIVESLPVTLLVAASIWQIFFMEQTGAIRRIAGALKKLTGDDRIAASIIINIGFAAILWGVGLNPLSILPLLLLSLGYPQYAAVALPAVGSAALFIYAFLGAPLETFHFYAGGAQTFDQAGGYFLKYMWPATLVISLGVLYLTGGCRAVWKGFGCALLATAAVYLVSTFAVKGGFVRWTGVMSGALIIVFMLLRQAAGSKGVRNGRIHEDDDASGRGIGLFLALLPLILTAALFLLTRLIEPVKYFVVEILSVPVNIIPAHVIHIAPLSQPYLLTVIATLLVAPCYRSGWMHLRDAGLKCGRYGLRPVLSAAFFFAAAFIMWHSGKVQTVNEYGAMAWVIPQGHANMIHVMVSFCESIFRELYALPAAIAGLRMGFISGSETVPIMMLTKAHIEAAEGLLKPGGAGIHIAAVSAVAASLMVMVNPARLQNASAVIGESGMESRVWRTSAVIAIVTVAVVAFIAYTLSTL